MKEIRNPEAAVGKTMTTLIRSLWFCFLTLLFWFWPGVAVVILVYIYL